MRFGIRELTFGLIAVAIVFGAYVNVFATAGAAQAALRTDMQAKRSTLAAFRQSTSGLEELERKTGELRRAIDGFDSQIPTDKQIDAVFKALTQLADANSLQARQNKPTSIEGAGKYGCRSVEMALTGNFNGFYSFLLQLEKLPSVVHVDQLELHKTPERDGEIQARLLLSVYCRHQPADDVLPEQR